MLLNNYFEKVRPYVLCFAGYMYLLIKPFTSVITGFLVIILQMRKLRLVEIM